jgi:hypothetical protein
MKKFSTWLEQREGDVIEQAILGTIGGSDSGAMSDHEKEHLRLRSTQEFSDEILDRLRNLGVIKNVGDDDPQLYNDIIEAIHHGIKIGELIDKVRGPNFAPRGTIEEEP